MHSLLAFAALPIAPAVAETVLGAYIFARHGDRTAKVLGDTQLTNLGYREVFETGTYYHDRYIASNSSEQIAGINDAVVDEHQVTVYAPNDLVIENSAIGFTQAMYPPAGNAANQGPLRNNTTVQVPLNGYQLIPLSPITTGDNSEDAAWLESANQCSKGQVSSNRFYSSSIYKDLQDSTKGFYQNLARVLSSAFSMDDMDFRHAYTIWDYLNVALIHNASTTTPALNNVPQADISRLMHLANIQQFHLAYNQSEPIRAIAGKVLAGEVVKALNKTITSQGKSKLNMQFGSYATFLSYFGLAQLPAVNDNFYGFPHYSSTMAWELVTNSTSSGFPDPSELSVRFTFHNGTITNTSSPVPYPLYGQSSLLLSWSDFVDQTHKFSVNSEEQWCDVCENTQGKCLAVKASQTGATLDKSGGMSLAVAGVIGAFVTLAVILGLEVLFFLVGGFRISKKRRAQNFDVPLTGGSDNKF